MIKYLVTTKDRAKLMNITPQLHKYAVYHKRDPIKIKMV